MFFPVILLLSIIVIIILITLFFVRTYDTIDNIQTASQQKFVRHEDNSIQLENKFDAITKDNEKSISESKDEMMKRLKKIKAELDRVDDEIVDTVKMVKDEDARIRKEILEVDNGTKERLRHFEVGMEEVGEDIQALRDIDREAELKKNELKKTLEELERDINRELDILEGKIDTTNTNLRVYEESIQSDFMDVQKDVQKDVQNIQEDVLNMQEDVQKEVDPLREAISKLEQQIDASKIKISDYSFNYDPYTRNLNLEYLAEDDPDRAGVLNVDEVDMDKATVSDFALINNASISGTTTFKRESDSDSYMLRRGNGGLSIQMPPRGSVQFNTFDMNDNTPKTQHHFSADGTAEHSQVIADTIKTPKLDFGRYSMMIKDGELVLHDSALDTHMTLSEE